ncbi:hypothetical protein ASAC_0482 [Acidilobus saccharovorans 345-15]|uniref:Uncharacterized protein n=1 Tax=Acidilobus saccharovorans (strain DSM 16705 / JCM 18335 / VKM B-2471 / 345-15) TaxID=666510 RepID=D9Q0Q1_ACIS3|nr:hypothetical protein [Acidilobus saccharovorans]ADL18889.1 hypothetical protein ASAC_0482 [Acidilobus saccharovorans 345-15]
MTLEALQYAVNSVFGHFGGLQLSSAGNVLALVGIAMLLAIIVIGGVVLIARGIKAIGNLTPGKFLAVLIGLAVAFIVVGALAP